MQWEYSKTIKKTPPEIIFLKQNKSGQLVMKKHMYLLF